MTLQEFVQSKGINNVFAYANFEESLFIGQASEIGYEKITTFFADFSIAEWCSGASGIISTYNRVVKCWGNDVKYFTECILILNWKCWEWYNRKNDNWCDLYKALYNRAYVFAEDKFKGDDLSYFYNTLD